MEERRVIEREGFKYSPSLCVCRAIVLLLLWKSKLNLGKGRIYTRIKRGTLVFNQKSALAPEPITGLDDGIPA
jgi:hypothetical protein